MQRLSSFVLVLAVLAGLVWWQRATVVPFVTAHVPAAGPYLAKVPGLVPSATPAEAAESGGSGQGGGRRGRGGGGPVAVLLAKVEAKVLPVTVDAVGTASASASVPIHPRIDSQITSVDVAEGAKVKEGDPLFHLDDRAIRAQLAGIEAGIEKDQATIEQAQTDLKRATDLLTRSAGSQVTRDTAATAVKVAQAQLASDTASRDAMQTQLSYTVIRSPVSGRIGSIPARPGATVRSADATALATVNTIDPSQVSFAIPQARLPDLRAALDRGSVEVDVTQGRSTLSGTVAFVENSIDASTGTVTVKATVPNAREVLWPGAFVSVTVILDSHADAIAVPSDALQIGQDGPYLFVVKDNKAQLRTVTVDRTVGQDSVIGKGALPGESVVVDGQLRLVDGAPVEVKTPNADAAAAPASPATNG